MATLAMPVVVAEIGWVAMGLVDTLMVGPLGPEAIGAVGIGSAVFIGVVIFAMGAASWASTRSCRTRTAPGASTIATGGWCTGRCSAWCVSLPITLLLFGLTSLLGRWGLDPAVYRLSRPYLDVLVWSVAPLLLYATFRRYLQGMGVVRPVMIALVTANVTNVARQLGSHLRKARRAGHGRSRLRVGDGDLARGDGGVSTRRDRPP